MRLTALAALAALMILAGGAQAADGSQWSLRVDKTMAQLVREGWRLVAVTDNGREARYFLQHPGNGQLVRCWEAQMSSSTLRGCAGLAE